jgi:hypothetical protein
MATHAATIDPHGGLVNVDVLVGFAQFGRFRFWLAEGDGSNPVVVFDGDNADSQPDRFVLAMPASMLIGKKLVWKVIVGAFDTTPGQFYSVIVTLTQDGTVVADSPYSQQGSLDGVKIVHEGARFQ